jgi:hypothetical protein
MRPCSVVSPIWGIGYPNMSARLFQQLHDQPRDSMTLQFGREKFGKSSPGHYAIQIQLLRLKPGQHPRLGHDGAPASACAISPGSFARFAGSCGARTRGAFLGPRGGELAAKNKQSRYCEDDY